ncbi:MAG: hypothetical protein Q7R95_06175 [bacterium]|nr:hypothetical protein [bacterium]
MIDKLIFEAPLNPLSMGNVSINILLSLYKKGIKVLYLPIGQPDIGNYKLTDDFKNWLQDAGNRFLREFKKTDVHLKNWHLAGSHAWVSDKRYLLTYHECSEATQEEINTVKNTTKTLFCGNYSPSIFKNFSDNVGTFNLGFDSNSFSKTNKKYFNDNRLQWFLGGKAELRKNSWQILNLWAKKFGKKQGESYKPGERMNFLNICIANPFYDINVQNQQINQALEGQRYCNIQAFPFLGREQFNDLLNSSDFDLTGLSSGESWNLPAFNMTCLGKWSIVLNCTGQKSWSTSNNSIQISPNGMRSNIDNIFFHPNQPFNRGQFYTFDPEEANQAMQLAVDKYADKPNIEGEKLQTEFTYDKTVDNILKEIEN